MSARALRPLALGLALGGAVLLVLDAIATRAGLAHGVLPTLAGTAPWTLSRAAGVTAFAALALDVIAGLAMSTGVGDRALPRARSLELHRTLSAVALALTALHAVALLVDRFIRFDVVAVLVPLASPYRAPAVALGVIAAYAALVVHLSFDWRKRLGARTWRRLHHLAFVAFTGALVHAIAAGTDRGARPLQLLYATTAVAVLALVGVRLRGLVRTNPLLDRSAPRSTADPLSTQNGPSSARDLRRRRSRARPARDAAARS